MNTATRAKVHPVQGLTCFHNYKDRDLKTLSIDMLYTSMEALETVTELTLDTETTEVCHDREPDDPDIEQRITSYVRKFTDRNFQVKTSSNFTSAVGLASSASGFACLAGAVSKALDLPLDSKEISKRARIGSFSANASVTGGISLTRAGKNGQETYGEQVFHPSQLRDVTLVIGLAAYKKRGIDFYRECDTSPLFKLCTDYCRNDAKDLIRAFEERDIDKMADISEMHTMLNYAVLQTGEHRLLLWRPESIIIMNEVRRMRKEGLPMFFSMNTGANVFVYCFSEAAVSGIRDSLEKNGVGYMVSKIGGGLAVE